LSQDQTLRQKNIGKTSNQTKGSPQKPSTENSTTDKRPKTGQIISNQRNLEPSKKNGTGLKNKMQKMHWH
ncbi:hypothetical protein L2520_09170, partial [Limosilactobacillus vaginalis]|uniref:hypothetical protein n=1 Tax=Limosilactobacillus vaginalis TaxID=1633 RepID=UPI0022AF0786